MQPTNMERGAAERVNTLTSRLAVASVEGAAAQKVVRAQAAEKTAWRREAEAADAAFATERRSWEEETKRTVARAAASEEALQEGAEAAMEEMAGLREALWEAEGRAKEAQAWVAEERAVAKRAMAEAEAVAERRGEEKTTELREELEAERSRAADVHAAAAAAAAAAKELAEAEARELTARLEAAQGDAARKAYEGESLHARCAELQAAAERGRVEAAEARRGAAEGARLLEARGVGALRAIEAKAEEAAESARNATRAADRRGEQLHWAEARVTEGEGLLQQSTEAIIVLHTKLQTSEAERDVERIAALEGMRLQERYTCIHDASGKKCS